MGRKVICIGKGALGKAFEAYGVTTLDKKECDVNDIHSLNETFLKYKPEIVINCTGLVGTKICEENKSESFLINIGGVVNLIYICNKYNVKLIHFSTFYSGISNTYTHTKFMSDYMLDFSNIDNLIIKLPWMFGNFNNNNFIKDAIFGESKIYKNENGYICYDYDLIKYVLDNLDKSGLISIANEGKVSREDVIRFIGKKWKYIYREIPMMNSLIRPKVELRNWKEALGEYINGLRTM